MDNLIKETNENIQSILNNLKNIKEEYEAKIAEANKQFNIEVAKSKQYKRDFFIAKAKIDKMNKDIAGFEEDYRNLVEKFKDDELANILIAANKEISSKVDERKRKIIKDKNAMNELVQKAANVKTKLIKLTAEKKNLENDLNRILDIYNYYEKSLSQILEYTNEHPDNLSSIFNDYDTNSNIVDINDNPLDDSILDDSILLDYKEISEALMDTTPTETENDSKENTSDKDSNDIKEHSEKKVEEQTKNESKDIDQEEVLNNDDDIELDIQINDLLDEIDESILDDDENEKNEELKEEELYLDEISLDDDFNIKDDDDDDEGFDEELEKILNSNDSLD